MSAFRRRIRGLAPSKNSACADGQIISTIPARPRPQEGRIAIVTKRWARMRWPGLARQTKRAISDGEVVWSWRLDAGVNTATTLTRCAGDGDKKARSPERARSKP